MRQDKSRNNRWLLSGACGLALLAASGSVALAQNVPTSDATAPQGPGAATQVIQLKPGQEAGTPTVMPADTAGNPAASTQDAHFVWAASATNQAEIVLGKLAQDRGQSPNEQNYGRMLKGDHGNAELWRGSYFPTFLEPCRLAEKALTRSFRRPISGHFDPVAR